MSGLVWTSVVHCSPPLNVLSSGGEIVVRQVMVFPSSDSVDGEVVLGTMLIDAMLWLKDWWEVSVPPPPHTVAHLPPHTTPRVMIQVWRRMKGTQRMTRSMKKRSR